ncbi:4-hydroxythreonine-4-phosphate dehydrogenase PdxA [Pseudochryseolinea flava]|uniref:4-hydroxythreonine-4-phosphate dehydrogenase PdxA n=1 Tax=Pseudochryseolinea flava TaxID=2059302 RepID=A0A364Y5P5_9BACT|nr:4-hydroxythreonine-4-phosphate dehydrogenase PdxA [Pseudochryseolinea flava]RAW01681.1 4-hydroxythreonine-4-phosphate dehydrogenase PdxA [Pseudochryseolinea flava]
MNHPNKPRIGITLGDPNGVGPEVVIKTLADNRILNLITPVIYGSAKAISFYKKQLNIEEFNYTQVRTKGQLAAKSVNVVNCWEENMEITPGKASRDAGKAALIALKQASTDLKEGLLDALVTAPIDKQTIHSDEFPFKGHTEFLTDFFGEKDSLMFMVSDKLRVALVTEHIAVKDIAGTITKEKIESKLKLMEHSLRKDFGVVKPRIAILGLNPHAGDNGLLGTEEEQIIKPLIAEQKNKGKLVYGPFPADGFFGTGSYAKYDGVLAMYHDQGLVPFKAIAFENGVNFTAGLPIVRTSPDHGTGYGLAGKNQADETSTREAVYRAMEIFRYRTEQSTEK